MIRGILLVIAGAIVGWIAGVIAGWRTAVNDYANNDAEMLESHAERMTSEIPDEVKEKIREAEKTANSGSQDRTYQ